ncbi:tonB-system energizer ExbB [Rhizobium sp. SSA_523]|uniref:tonB-system energizer ExbB n=1 Tax=Rhizobium sp. SSA_523 TaxID=2952477 RepID=UPI00209069DD|nr:tonB-system energizer ExbB [Rhizobium sp. SSA_523]MCO5732891.1 tonB-system energizer ExbB [Rhizobium sp. SSA_523]WKC23492.1 tonB-system energizer ExbB [Rhizobium sp. SSA_523]
MPRQAKPALFRQEVVTRASRVRPALALAAALLAAQAANAQEASPAPQTPAATQPRLAQPTQSTQPQAAEPSSPAPAAPSAPIPSASTPSAPTPSAAAPSALEPSASSPAAPAQAPSGQAPTAPAPAAPQDAAPSQGAAPTEGGAPQGAADQTVTPTAPAGEGDQAAPAEDATVPQQAEDIFNQLLSSERRSDIPHDLSPIGMFLAADWVVKSVMIGLALASLVTWTVWLAKSLELAGARRRAKKVIRIIRQTASLSEAVSATEGRGGPAAAMLREAAREVALSEPALDHAENAGVKERVSSTLGRIEAYAGRRMMRGTGALATIGSVAPFVGLFGTVWGIMNAFIGISESQTTNLAVVAPGIAEALLATAIGLVAAIPAVVIYNMFARSITGYRQLLADAAAGVERLVSRDLDFRKVPPGQRKLPVSLVAGE